MKTIISICLALFANVAFTADNHSDRQTSSQMEVQQEADRLCRRIRVERMRSISEGRGPRPAIVVMYERQLERLGYRCQ